MPKETADRMPNSLFRLMHAIMVVKDRLFPLIDQRVATFGLREGMTVVDYGCGPGRYATRFATSVGPTGTVYAVDIHELAIAAVRRTIQERTLQNIVPVLATGYATGLPNQIADVVCVIDMFFCSARSIGTPARSPSHNEA